MTYRLARIVSFVMIVVIAVLLSGCGGDEEDEGKPTSIPKTEDDRGDPTPGPQASALSGETFTFSDGAVFDAGLSGSEVQLTFGSFSGATGPFTLAADDTTARGTVTLGSCSLAITASDFPAGQGPQVGATIVLEPCTLDTTTGDLVLTNASTGVAARSVPVAQEFPRHGIGTSWSFAIDASYPESAETVAYQVTGRREHRGREVLVIEVTYQFADSLETEVQLLDAETGNAVAYLDDDLVSDGPYGEFVPHDGRFSFPMKVGNTWRATYTEIDYFDSGEETVQDDWEVVAYEEVTVPAGTFIAYRLTLADASSTNLRGGGTFSYWYAPEVGFFVKIDGQDTEEGGYYVLELTDYELKEPL